MKKIVCILLLLVLLINRMPGLALERSKWLPPDQYYECADQYEYTHDPYMNSGVNPDNGFTEKAAFTVPTLAQ